MSHEVPEGWASTTLGELAQISGGTTPSKEVGEFWERGRHFWATPTDITALPPGKVKLSSTKTMVSDAALQKTSLKMLPVGSVLMTSRATIGYPAINAVPVATNQGFANFHPSAKYDAAFLAYWIVFSRKILERSAGGSTFPEISKSALRSIHIALPPLHEQWRIAEILSSVDEAIAATRAVIEQTRKVKQGVLERLLTKGIGHTRFKQTEIGEIPEGWPLTNADDVCTQISVGIVIKPSQYYVESGVRCFRSANVREGFVEDADWVYISEEGNRVNQKSVLRSGDVLVVRTGYPGTSCVVPLRYDGANCIDIIFARPKIELVDPYFLSTFINSASGKTQVLKAEGGLAQKHFNVGAMKQMKLPLPPLHEQHEIVAHIQEFASTETALVRILEQRLRLKSALMSDLFTGRKRVIDALPVAAE